MSARTLSRAEVLSALLALQSGEVEPGKQFDWNRDWVHGYAARDVAGALYRSPRFRSATWTEVLPVLEALARDGEIVRVVPRRSRKAAVPVYRTVGS